LQEAPRQDDLPTRHGERVDKRAVEDHDPCVERLVGGGQRKAAAQPLECGPARRRLAHLSILGHRGNHGLTKLEARFERHVAGDGLGWVQVESPQAADAQRDRAKHAEPRF
jgi:hypothetical protein